MAKKRVAEIRIFGVANDDHKNLKKCTKIYSKQLTGSGRSNNVTGSETAIMLLRRVMQEFIKENA